MAALPLPRPFAALDRDKRSGGQSAAPRRPPFRRHLPHISLALFRAGERLSVLATLILIDLATLAVLAVLVVLVVLVALAGCGRRRTVIVVFAFSIRK